MLDLPVKLDGEYSNYYVATAQSCRLISAVEKKKKNKSFPSSVLAPQVPAMLIKYASTVGDVLCVCVFLCRVNSEA